MMMSLWQLRRRYRVAMVRSHYTLAEEEISEQGGDHQILTKELFEQCPRQNVPGYRVCNSRENPIQLSKWTPSVLQTSRHRYLIVIDHYARRKWILKNKETQRYINWRRQAAGEQICWQVGVSSQRYAEAFGLINRWVEVLFVASP